jgi:hypothetical protein
MFQNNKEIFSLLMREHTRNYPVIPQKANQIPFPEKEAGKILPK